MMKRTFPLMLVVVLLTTVFVSTPTIPAEEELADWTFMVYLAGGNNLEGAGIEDMNEMEIVGSSENLNIIVLFDRIAGYDTSEGDWQGTRTYRVKQDSDLNKLAEYTEGVDVWGSEEDVDQNMGDPQTLVDFAVWTIDTFPAKNYALVMWNHGAGFWGICWDDAYEDALNMTELSDALFNITEYAGQRIGVVGFDACLMAQTAVMYQIKDYAEVGVGSGFVEPGDGWPYDTVLGPLSENTKMTPLDLGKNIVDAYIESYTNREDDPQDTVFASMAAFDLAKFEAAAEEISRLGMAMSIGPGRNTPAALYYSKLAYIRSRTACYDLVSLGPFNYHYCFYDVIDFCDRLGQDPALDALHPYAQNVKSAVGDTMYHAKTNDAQIKHHGLTVYFPSGTQTTYDSKFDATLFAQDRYWDSFLLNYEANTLVPNTPPSVTIDTPLGSKTFPTTESHVTISGTAFDMQNTLVSVEMKVGDGEWITLEGKDTWSHDMPLDGTPGPKTLSVRAFDGEEYSPEVSRTFLVVGEASYAPSGSQGRGGAWALLLIPLLLVAAYVVYKKKIISSL